MHLDVRMLGVLLFLSLKGELPTHEVKRACKLFGELASGCRELVSGFRCSSRKPRELASGVRELVNALTFSHVGRSPFFFSWKERRTSNIRGQESL